MRQTMGPCNSTYSLSGLLFGLGISQFVAQARGSGPRLRLAIHHHTPAQNWSCLELEASSHPINNQVPEAPPPKLLSQEALLNSKLS